MRSVTCPEMLFVTSASTLAVRARSLNVRRSPRGVNFISSPIKRPTLANDHDADDGRARGGLRVDPRRPRPTVALPAHLYRVETHQRADRFPGSPAGGRNRVCP